MTQYPGRGEILDHAMVGHHGAEAIPMLDAYDFSAFKEIVDVGGGHGSLLTTVLERLENLKGVLFDLPAVVDRARPDVEAAGFGDRLRIVVGSFLKQEVPPGADAYTLRHVVHDWNVIEGVPP